jgi:D-alanyl-lipoteichoic acid acyltransferase DltB (MBOAT superfamily)
MFSSIAFVVFASGWVTLPFLGCSIFISWLGAILIERKAKTQRMKSLLLFATIAILVVGLIMKYFNFFIHSANAFSGLINLGISLDEVYYILPIGMAYYQLTLIGYVTDVYRQTCEPQSNIFRHALFSSWFPILTCGPILRKKEMDAEFFGIHTFDYRQLCFGIQRMIWGYFKKLVIADRLSVFVGAVYSDIDGAGGVYIAIAAIAFLFQLYCDFSGCMDIIIGTSQCFGIKLPENFRTPFFSENIGEWWRRWHITLGDWSRDYLLYPLLKSSPFQRLGTRSKLIFGKKVGKKIPVYLVSIILWIIIGIWHGGSTKWLFAAGLIPVFWFILSESFGGTAKKVGMMLPGNNDSVGFNLFRMIRTSSMICVALLIAPASNFLEGLAAWKIVFADFGMDTLHLDTLLSFELVLSDFIVVGLGLIIVWIVDLLHEKGYSLRELIASRNIAIRWSIYYGAIFSVLIFGEYGNGYNAGVFIYMW